jgi:hypothetical protein
MVNHKGTKKTTKPTKVKINFNKEPAIKQTKCVASIRKKLPVTPPTPTDTSEPTNRGGNDIEVMDVDAEEETDVDELGGPSQITQTHIHLYLLSTNGTKLGSPNIRVLQAFAYH